MKNTKSKKIISTLLAGSMLLSSAAMEEAQEEAVQETIPEETIAIESASQEEAEMVSVSFVDEDAAVYVVEEVPQLQAAEETPESASTEQETSFQEHAEEESEVFVPAPPEEMAPVAEKVQESSALLDDEEPLSEEPATVSSIEDLVEEIEVLEEKPAAVISSLETKPVSTNEKYTQLSFSFTSEGREYNCLITGLEEAGVNTIESYQRLAEAVVQGFLSGEVFKLSNQTAASEYDLNLDLIDAEKISRYTDGDKNICWAASAADMLEFAGWNREEAGDEDTIFQEYREEFNDLGGYQTSGISWYMDGVNPVQNITTSGKVVFQDLNRGASQQQMEGTGGYWTEYAAGQVAPDTGYYDDIELQLEAAVDQLDEGYAVGVGAYYYREDGTVSSGHALTVFGYIREKLDQAISAIRALFISDSDNDATRTETEDPAERPNEYALYRVAPYESETITALQLEDYDQSTLTTVLGIVSTLQPKTQAAPETEGTKNAVADPNLVPSEMHLLDENGLTVTEAEQGDTVNLATAFENRSYQKLPVGAQVRYVVDVYRDGELVGQYESMAELEEVRPNRESEATIQLRLEEPGEYSFATRILGISTADGTPIQEAYVNDNEYLGVPRKLIVRGSPKSADAPAPTEEIIIPETGSSELANKIGRAHV